MNNNMYSLGSNKPLINREQNYVLDRKLLSVHSEDRDITKWSHSNHFEIILPETINNVQSLRLVEIALPASFYTFSNQYQNTKFQFTLNSAPNTPIKIEIQEGFYTPEELALELTNKMNKAAGVTTFNVHYDSVSQKMWIGNTTTSFKLDFSTKMTYDFSLNQCHEQYEQFNVWDQYTKWGLPSYLGFDKVSYSSSQLLSNKTFDYLPLPNTWTNASNVAILHYVEAPNNLNIMGDKCIYMEVDKYNSMDELYPYTKSTNNMYDNSGYSGKVNSAFAKIPITSPYDKMVFDSRTLFLQNITHYEPPIERISKLKFTFRFHDGRLVDFQDCPFDFTLEFNSLKNEIARSYNVRVPSTYLI
jgi:hypothetical protein